MRLFDTHTHLLDSRFDGDRDAVIDSLSSHGVSYVVEAASSIADAPRIIELVEKYGFIYGAIGTHPHEASEMKDSDLELARETARHEKIVAIGEIGLDYHYDFSPRDIQKKRFIEQLDLAAELDLPVIVHVREATEDALRILRSRKGKLRGVMHCFSGSVETAREYVDMGLYIGFGGSLTFKNAVNLASVAAKLPIESMLIETDCPYMTPEPFRGRRNTPEYVFRAAERIAELKGMTADEVAEETLKNGMKLFGIEE